MRQPPLRNIEHFAGALSRGAHDVGEPEAGFVIAIHSRESLTGISIRHVHTRLFAR